MFVDPSPRAIDKRNVLKDKLKDLGFDLDFRSKVGKMKYANAIGDFLISIKMKIDSESVDWDRLLNWIEEFSETKAGNDAAWYLNRLKWDEVVKLVNVGNLKEFIASTFFIRLILNRKLF